MQKMPLQKIVSIFLQDAYLNDTTVEFKISWKKMGAEIGSDAGFFFNLA